MKLQDFLKENSLTHAAFAEMVGVRQATINRYVRGERFPSPDMIKTIQKVTAGRVAVADWYDAEAAE